MRYYTYLEHVRYSYRPGKPLSPPRGNFFSAAQAAAAVLHPEPHEAFPLQGIGLQDLPSDLVVLLGLSESLRHHRMNVKIQPT